MIPVVLPLPARRRFGRRALPLTLFAASACASSPPPAPPPPPPPPPAFVAAEPAPALAPSPAPSPRPVTELALATHRAFFDALRAEDESALAALYAPDAVVDVGVGVTEARGRPAVTALAKALWQAFPGGKVQWGTLVQSGSALAVELAWTGAHTGLLGELAPTKRVVGAHALLLERFDAAGLIESQRLYVDTATLVADLAPHAGKPHAFDGLPTSQTTVLDGVSPAPEDDAAMKSLVSSLRQGSFLDLRALGTDASAWTDATKGHTVRGKGAIQLWASFLERSYRGLAWAPERLVGAFSAGPWQVLEWSSSAPGAPADARDATGRASLAPAHAAELVRFEGGHVVEVHTYRAPAPALAPGPRAQRPSTSRGKNQ
jgi:hypothetical protein